MRQLNILTMEEYEPVHGDVVDIYLADTSYSPVTNIQLKSATVEITYQAMCADTKETLTYWTSDTPENMSKIEFNKPFLHLTEDYPENPDMNKIIGYRYIEDSEWSLMEEAAKVINLNSSLRRIYEDDQEREFLCDLEQDELKYKDVPIIYWEKRWFLNIKSNYSSMQIWDKDYDNEVLGIIDKHALAELIKREGIND